MASPLEVVPDIDLGHDHYLTFTRWAPEDLLANRRWLRIPDCEPIPIVEKWGASIRHYKPDGQLCEGFVTFDGFWQRKFIRDRWVVECWEPLTCSPSLLCHCGDHGFIRNGKWEKA